MWFGWSKSTDVGFWGTRWLDETSVNHQTLDYTVDNIEDVKSSDRPTAALIFTYFHVMEECRYPIRPMLGLLASTSTESGLHVRLHVCLHVAWIIILQLHLLTSTVGRPDGSLQGQGNEGLALTWSRNGASEGLHWSHQA